MKVFFITSKDEIGVADRFLIFSAMVVLYCIFIYLYKIYINNINNILQQRWPLCVLHELCHVGWFARGRLWTVAIAGSFSVRIVAFLLGVKNKFSGMNRVHHFCLKVEESHIVLVKLIRRTPECPLYVESECVDEKPL